MVHDCGPFDYVNTVVETPSVESSVQEQCNVDTDSQELPVAEAPRRSGRQRREPTWLKGYEH